MVGWMFVVAFGAFTVADVVLYCKAEWPRRMNMRYRRWLPGSGFVAYLSEPRE